jgi:hypothetical protein
MTRTRPLATAALALGALATTAALQTAPADAFQVAIKAAGDAGSAIHTVAGRPGSFGNGPIPAGPDRNPAPFNAPGNFGNGGSGKFTSQQNPGAFNPFKAPGGNKLAPSGSQENPNAFDPNQYRPPVAPQDGPTPFPTPTSSQKNPNAFDPTKLPGGNGGGNIPPIGDPIANPNLPGGGTKGPKGHGHYGIYVDVGGGYNPCWWLRRNYYNTGRIYWLNRYRFCMWRHYGE